MSEFSLEGGGPADLGVQLTALREDIACLTTHARRLEAALAEVRDLMKHLPPHDQATEVAIRLRGHFEYLATHIIGDALDDPTHPRPPEDAIDA